ncbi:hypothetical protein Vi05172_g7786 [Venturia inaequalis]|nr:hypothetical protein Vi05172_g7786 [Venturia inaequalis]
MKIQTILLLVGTAIAMAPPYSEAELKAGKTLLGKRCQAKGQSCGAASTGHGCCAPYTCGLVEVVGAKASAYYKCK